MILRKYFNILTTKIILQACNKEFFGAGEVFWNKGTLISISSATHEIKAPQGKMFEFFLLDNLKATF